MCLADAEIPAWDEGPDGTFCSSCLCPHLGITSAETRAHRMGQVAQVQTSPLCVSQDAG